jgi:hypothetical protein
MQERPSVKKLLAYEKEVNEGFPETAYATIELTLDAAWFRWFLGQSRLPGAGRSVP